MEEEKNKSTIKKNMEIHTIADFCFCTCVVHNINQNFDQSSQLCYKQEFFQFIKFRLTLNQKQKKNLTNESNNHLTVG